MTTTVMGAKGGPILPTAVFEHDAGLLASYAGGGAQKWADIVTSPADGSAQTDYDFYLGTTSGATGSDPTFHGTPGNNSASEYWSFDGGDLFTLVGNDTTFLNSLHKDAALFTWYAFLRSGPDFGLTGSLNAFGTRNSSGTTRGIEIIGSSGSGTSDGKLQFVMGNGSVSQTVAQSGNNFIPISTNMLLAVSYNESTGAGIMYRNYSGGKSVYSFTQAYVSPSSSSAGAKAEIMGLGGGSEPTGPGQKLWRTGMFNAALTEANLDGLYSLYSFKLA